MTTLQWHVLVDLFVQELGRTCSRSIFIAHCRKYIGAAAYSVLNASVMLLHCPQWKHNGDLLEYWRGASRACIAENVKTMHVNVMVMPSMDHLGAN